MWIAVVIVLVGLCVLYFVHRRREHAQHQAETLLRSGTPGRGRILHLRWSDELLASITVEVQPATGAPYTTTFVQDLDLYRSDVHPGSWVELRVDPRTAANVVIAGGRRAPENAVGDLLSENGSSGYWNQGFDLVASQRLTDDVLARGLPAKGRIVRVDWIYAVLAEITMEVHLAGTPRTGTRSGS
jgi:hypothetical protein